MKKFIFIFFTFLFLAFLPLLCSAVELEQTYPDLPTQQAISGSSSITDLIIYLSTWALILAAIVVVISLVIAGIEYLTSSGRPEKMTGARKKIGNAFLGLAILAGSYLILVTINPQLTVLTLEYVPVESGLFLFTKQGYTEFAAGEGFTELDSLIKQKKAYPLTRDIINMSFPFELGGLMVEEWKQGLAPQNIGEAEKVNFLDVPVYAIGFSGALEQDAKVIMYAQENFKGDQNSYTFKGKLDKQGNIDEAHKAIYLRDPHGMQLIKFSVDFTRRNILDPKSYDADFFKTIKEIPPDPGFHVDYVNLKVDEYYALTPSQQEQVQTELELASQLDGPPPVGAYDYVKSRYESGALDDLIYPPLSLQIRRTGPGVYLYASEANHSEERRFLTSQDDLSRSDIDFDKKAEKIKIINKKIAYDASGAEVTLPDESHNYLAAVHEDTHYTGNLRFFFEQKLDTTEQIPIMCDDPAPPESHGKPQILFPGNSDIICGFDGFNAFNPSDPDKKLEEYVDGFGYYPDNGISQLITGNSGQIDDPLTPAIEDDVEPRNMVIDIALPMDIRGKQANYGAVEYVSSVSIYELSKDASVCREVRICTEKAFETGEEGGDGYCISYSYKNSKTKTVPELGVVKFGMPLYKPVNIPDKAWVVKSKDAAGNIDELEEKGFSQNIKSIHIAGDCLVGLFENKVEDWSNGSPMLGPGPHSQFFTKSKQDLGREEIGRCGSGLRRVAGRYLNNSCAQSIVIYPIKRKEQ